MRSIAAGRRRCVHAAVLSALLLSGCGKAADAGKPQGKRGADGPAVVEVQTAATRPIGRTVHGTGAIEAYETVRVSTRVAGVLDRLLVAEGDTVAQGAVIAEIEAERYRLAAGQADAQAARAEAELTDARVAIARREGLAKDGMITAEELDQARNRVRLAEADLAAARAARDKARLDLDDATVKAPIAGVIQTRDVHTGSYLQVGAQLVTLVQREPLLVRFNVPVADAAELAPGQEVNLVSRGNRDPFTGTIHLVSVAADPGTRQVGVVARVADPTHRLRPGAFAEVAVELPPRVSIVVPGLAVRTTERGALILVVVDGKLAEREVEIGGHAADGAIEIASGLAVGEQVVVRAADGLGVGKAVRVVDADGRPAGGGAAPPADRSALADGQK